MKKYIITTIFLGIILCLSSCYKDLDLEDYRSEPKIVLNSVISPEIEVMASISRTIFYSDTKDPNAAIKDPDIDLYIKDSDINLYINNKFVEKMLWVEDPQLPNKGLYKSNVKPMTGDLVKIVANTSLGTAWAEDVVPPKIEIKNIKLSHRIFKDPNSIIVSPNGSFTEATKCEIRYHITFNDDAKNRNFYCIRIENTADMQPLGLLDYSLDPVFKVQQSVIDGSSTEKMIEGQGGRTFSDDIINGKEYTMIIRETSDISDYGWGKNLYRRISLLSISEAYYKYLTSLLNLNDNKISQKLDEWGLAEPTPFYSNVHGGTGVMGSTQDEYKLIDLREILPEYWDWE